MSLTNAKYRTLSKHDKSFNHAQGFVAQQQQRQQQRRRHGNKGKRNILYSKRKKGEKTCINENKKRQTARKTGRIV